MGGGSPEGGWGLVPEEGKRDVRQASPVIHHMGHERQKLGPSRIPICFLEESSLPSAVGILMEWLLFSLLSCKDGSLLFLK